MCFSHLAFDDNELKIHKSFWNPTRIFRKSCYTLRGTPYRTLVRHVTSQVIHLSQAHLGSTNQRDHEGKLNGLDPMHPSLKSTVLVPLLLPSPEQDVDVPNPSVAIALELQVMDRKHDAERASRR